MKKTKKVVLRFAKISFLSFFILSNLFALAQPVFAQTVYTQVNSIPGANRPLPTEITNINSKYKDLFDRTSTLALSTDTDWNTNPTKATDLTFALSARFGGGDTIDPSDYWNLIADKKGDRNIFLLRFCPVGSDEVLDETNCGFASWPYARTVIDDVSSATTFTREEATFIESAGVPGWSVPNMSENIALINTINSKLDDLRLKKIYHYRTKLVAKASGDRLLIETDSKEEIDTFSNSFKPTTLYKAGNTLDTPIEKTLVKGARYQADLWYCAAYEDGLESLASNKEELEKLIKITGTDQLRIFGTLCDEDHLAYIRLAGFRFKVPATAEEIAAANGENQTPDATENRQTRTGDDSVLPTCAWFGFGSGSFVGCLAKLVYYLIFKPVNWITSMFGSLFDFFLGYSISDEAYRMGFAVEGWKLIRDISNIFFIVILVWTGFAAVFDMGGISMKKVVPTLIINALIINFSLFATRAVIDISNVITRVFYNTMQVQDKEGNNIETAGYKSISTLIVSSFNPQRIFQTQKIRQGALEGSEYCPGGEGEKECLKAVSGQVATFETSRTSASQEFTNAAQKGRGSTEYAGFFIIVTILATLILVAVAKMFWKVAFFFLGRTIGLYVTMIFSPFAFLTRGGVPLLGGIKSLNWSTWSGDLTKYALLGPIFILFLYVIVLFAGSDFALSITGRTFFETVIGIAVPMLIVYFMMKKAVAIAEAYSGEIGTIVQSTIEKTTGGFGAVVGGGIGLAAGVAAFAGRQTIGRGIRWYGRRGIKEELDADGKIIKTTRAQRWAANAKNSKWAMTMNAVQRGAQTGTWDVRNTKAGSMYGNVLGKFGGAADVKFEDKLSKEVGLDKTAGKGGVNATDKAWAKSMNARREALFGYSHLSDDESKVVWEKYKAEQIKKYGEAEWEKHIIDTEAMKFHKEKSAMAEKELKEAKDALKKAQEEGKTSLAADRLRVKRAEENVEETKKEKDVAEKQLIEDIKMGKHTNRKKEAVEASEKAERDRLDKYGVARNAESLKKMMSGEYAYELQNRSFWERQGPWGAFGILGLTLGGLVGTVTGGALLGSFMESLTATVTGVDKEALKQQVKDGMKGSGRANSYVQWKEALEGYDKKILELVKKHTGETYSAYADAKIEQIEAALDAEEDELQAIIDNAGADPKDRRRAKRDLKKIQDLHKDRKTTKKNIDDYDKKEEEKKEKK